MLGVKYERDDSKQGTGSDYGKQLMIGRVSGQDQILYQTERYHTSTFGYDMPVQGDGNYLLILKFSEVRNNELYLEIRNRIPLFFTQKGFKESN